MLVGCPSSDTALGTRCPSVDTELTWRQDWQELQEQQERRKCTCHLCRCRSLSRCSSCCGEERDSSGLQTQAGDRGGSLRPVLPTVPGLALLLLSQTEHTEPCHWASPPYCTRRCFSHKERKWGAPAMVGPMSWWSNQLEPALSSSSSSFLHKTRTLEDGSGESLASSKWGKAAFPRGGGGEELWSWGCIS